MNPLQRVARVLAAPPELALRAVSDLDDLAAFARRAFEDLHDIATLVRRVTAVEDELLTRVEQLEDEIAGLHSSVAPLSEQLERLLHAIAPVSDLPAVRASVAPLGEQLDELQRTVGELPGHVDNLEPMIEAVSASITDLHPKLGEVRDAVMPLGDLAEKMPGVRRRNSR